MTEPTALLLIDVIDSFFKEGMPNFYPEAPLVVGPLRELLSAARAGQKLIVHGAERHRPGLDDYEWQKLPRHHLAGAADAAVVAGFEMRGEREILLAKRRYSAFFATDLALLLHEQGVRRLVVAEVKTNVCIRASVQSAFAHGFAPIVPREATNSNRPHLAAASLEDIDRYFGRVVSLADAVAALA